MTVLLCVHGHCPWCVCNELPKEPRLCLGDVQHVHPFSFLKLPHVLQQIDISKPMSHSFPQLQTQTRPLTRHLAACTQQQQMLFCTIRDCFEGQNRHRVACFCGTNGAASLTFTDGPTNERLMGKITLSVCPLQYKERENV